MKKNKGIGVIGMILIIVGILVVGGGAYYLGTDSETKIVVTNFNECIEAGNPAMESYPRQCRHQDKVFIENIGNELEKSDLIYLDTPRPNQIIKNPLIIEGSARGFWFFEGDFPVILTDWDGLIIAEGYATAQSDSMTEEFVLFKSVLEFKNPTYKNNGSLILQKDNPSGLSEHDDFLEIPILFELENLLNPNDIIIGGEVTIGHEVRSFKLDDTTQELWLMGDLEEIKARFSQEQMGRYESLFMTLAGTIIDAPKDGFGADYQGAFWVKYLVDY